RRPLGLPPPVRPGAERGDRVRTLRRRGRSTGPPRPRRPRAQPLPRSHDGHARAPERAAGPGGGGGPPRPPRHPPPRRRPRGGYARPRVGRRGGPARRLPRPRDDGAGDADTARDAPPLSAHSGSKPYHGEVGLPHARYARSL